jgi:hypothetical protein
MLVRSLQTIRDICAPAGAPEGAGKYPVLDLGSGNSSSSSCCTSGPVLQVGSMFRRTLNG